jgi:formamidopyrimidine-DNA glycosylase
MIELPEAVTLARQLEAALGGRRVARVVADASPHKQAWFHGNPADYSDRLEGTTVAGATSDGGFVTIALGEVRLSFAEGVALRLHGKGEPRPAKHQLLVEWDDGAALSAAVQMYGGLWAYRSASFDNPYLAAAQRAPSPLSDGFDADYFDAIVGAPALQKLSAKALLATEQRVPGLGNGVLQDILFAARIHPRRRVGSLDDVERAALYDAVKETLGEMTRLGGRDTERDLHGRPGGYATRCSRHTVGTPCPRCAASIVKATYLGGTVYSCPGCQVVK